MTILVTGAAGYIGSHTCLELLSQGYEVIGVDNLINANSESIKRVEKLAARPLPLYILDISNQIALEAVFQQHSIDAVLHFAALKAVGESVQKPLAYYQNNITGLLTLCQLMESYQVFKLIFSSSATVYGNPQSVPINEEAPLSAVNPYGRTKLFGEEILKDLSLANRKWNITLLRYFNPVGAHPSGQIGENPNGIPNNLTPYITQTAIGRRPYVQIFGRDYPTPDGTGIRDYIHVMDLARGHIKALQALSRQTGIHAYNLGTGRGYSVLEVIQAFEKAAGKSIPFRFVKPRAGDIPVCFADPAMAEKELGWRAEKGLAEMCADAWRWQVQNPDGY